MERPEADLTPTQRWVAIGGWWVWFVALAGLLLRPPNPFLRKHAIWAIGWGLGLAVVFGGFPLFLLMVAAAVRSEAVRAIATLGGLGWSSLGFLVWVAGGVVNTLAVLQGKGPWMKM